jgi:hypothetical protein
VVAAWIKLAAAGMLRAEQISAAIGRGEAVKDEDLVRIMNAANRTVKELRDLKASRAKDTPYDIAAELRAMGHVPPGEQAGDDFDDDGYGESPSRGTDHILAKSGFLVFSQFRLGPLR